MPEPSISVVIPAYNASGTIAATLDTVFGQTRPPQQVIVVDDGSQDDLPAALGPHAQRVELIRQPNGGTAKARNNALDHARGDMVAFIDADDLWEPTKLEKQLDVFARHPEVGLVASRFRYVLTCERGEVRRGVCPDNPPALDQVIRATGPMAFDMATKCWTSSIIVRRDVLGEHRFTSGLEPAEDRDLWVRLILAAPLYLISEPLATAMAHPHSLSRSNVDKERTSMLRVVRRYADLLGPRGLRRWETTVYRQWASLQLARRHPGKAVVPAFRRLRHQPFSAEGWWVLLKSVSWSCASWSRKPAVTARLF